MFYIEIFFLNERNFIKLDKIKWNIKIVDFESGSNPEPSAKGVEQRDSLPWHEYYKVEIKLTPTCSYIEHL